MAAIWTSDFGDKIEIRSVHMDMTTTVAAPTVIHMYCKKYALTAFMNAQDTQIIATPVGSIAQNGLALYP